MYMNDQYQQISKFLLRLIIILDCMSYTCIRKQQNGTGNNLKEIQSSLERIDTYNCNYWRFQHKYLSNIEVHKDVIQISLLNIYFATS